MDGIDKENEVDEEVWVDDDDEDDFRLQEARHDANSDSMDIESGEGIDLGVPQLRDFLSDALYTRRW